MLGLIFELIFAFFAFTFKLFFYIIACVFNMIPLHIKIIALIIIVVIILRKLWKEA